VSDGRGGTDTGTVAIQAGNTPPAATISSPASTARFAVGQTITLTGSASDAEDGALGSGQLSWTVLLHHNSHTHPYFGPSSGNNLTFQAPAPEDLAATTTSYLEIYLTATDSSGASTTVRRDMQPQLVSVTLDSAPAGLSLNVNGATVNTPAMVTSWAAYRLGVNAPTQTDSAGRTWAFSSWSDGGAQSHTIVTPTNPATYTATFVGSSTPLDIVQYANDTTGFAGLWQLVPDATAAAGARIHTPDGSQPRPAAPLASPPSWAEWTFQAEAGRPYRLWIRGRADLDDPASDTAWVQFSGSVTSGGTATYRIGTTSAILWSLPDCASCAPSGWGWQDNAMGAPFGPLLYFANTGVQTIRVQVRDDGLSIDQIVLSPQTYLNASPGAAKNDTTIVSKPGNPPPPGNAPPTVTITSPSSTARFAVGQTITLAGSASDPEDGALGNAQLSWTVLLHHNTHTHSYFGPSSGNNLTFQAPAPEDLAATTTSYLEIYLTGTDSRGATTTVRRDMQPQLVSVTLESVPAGLALTANSTTVTTPATLTSWSGYQINLNAPAQNDSAGQAWVFSSWSDAGSQSHTVVTPAAAATYTATFTASSATPDILLYASDTTGFGGMYQLVADGSAAAGMRIHTPDGTVPRPNTALAAPPSWAEWSFHAEAGRPYRLWIRGKANGDDPASDTAWVQFSGSVSSSGTSMYRLGTTSAIQWSLSDCATCVPSGWGWQDTAMGAAFGPVLYFATTGPQIIRVQVRDDGLSIDQIVLSPQTYLNASPGATKNDATILAKQ
jgi:hypothetical protein